MRPSATESELIELLEGITAVLASEVNTREIDIIRWNRVDRRHKELSELASAARDDANISVRRMQAAKTKLIKYLERKQSERK